MPTLPKDHGLERRTAADGRTLYRASVRLPGSRQKLRGGWTASVAQARAERARLLARRGRIAEPRQTVAEAAEKFLALAEAGEAWTRSGSRYAPKTLRGYRQDFALWITPTLGAEPVDALRRSQVQALVDDVAAATSGQRARNVATALRALYRWLLPRHDDLQDPTHGLELPRGSAPREAIVTPEETLALVARLEGQHRVVFALAAMAGLRAGEVRALQRRDVEEDRIIVRAGWDAVEGRRALKHRQEGEGRAVPIFAPLRPILASWLALRPDDPEALLLPGRSGGAMDTDHALRRMRLAWGDLAPKGFRLHDARHTFASHLIVAGVDVATVALWIGHRQASTTLDRYVKPLRQRGVTPEEARAYLGL